MGRVFHFTAFQKMHFQPGWFGWHWMTTPTTIVGNDFILWFAIGGEGGLETFPDWGSLPACFGILVGWDWEWKGVTASWTIFRGMSSKWLVVIWSIISLRIRVIYWDKVVVHVVGDVLLVIWLHVATVILIFISCQYKYKSKLMLRN